MIGLHQIEDEHQNTYVHPDQAAQEIELVRELVRQAGTVQALARRWAPERRRALVSGGSAQPELDG